MSDRRRGRGIRTWAATRALASVMAGAVVFAGCATAPAPIVTFPPSTFGSGVITSATDATRRGVERALSGIGLTATDAQSPYRPGESPLFTAAPRTVLDVVLPGDGGVVPVSIYEFSNEDAAASAGDEQARYVASPVGKVQFAPGSEFVMRRDGRTIVFYAWLPPDERPGAGEIATALGAIGVEIEVPR